jgi:hypothetical protein
MQSERHALQKTSALGRELNTEDARKTRNLSHQWSYEDATGGMNASRNFGKAGARCRHRFG